MKAITLYGLAPDNSGKVHEAGTTLNVGDGADCICADRAADLVSINSAAVVADKPVIDKPVDDKKGA